MNVAAARRHMSRGEAAAYAAAAAILCAGILAAVVIRRCKRARRRRARVRAQKLEAAVVRGRHEAQVAPAVPLRGGAGLDTASRRIVTVVPWNRVLPGRVACEKGSPNLRVSGADWTRYLVPGSPLRVGAQTFQVSRARKHQFSYDANTDTTTVPLSTEHAWVDPRSGEEHATARGEWSGADATCLVGITTGDVDSIDYYGPTAGMVGHHASSTSEWRAGVAPQSMHHLSLDFDSEGTPHPTQLLGTPPAPLSSPPPARYPEQPPPQPPQQQPHLPPPATNNFLPSTPWADIQPAHTDRSNPSHRFLSILWT